MDFFYEMTSVNFTEDSDTQKKSNFKQKYSFSSWILETMWRVEMVYKTNALSTRFTLYLVSKTQNIWTDLEKTVKAVSTATNKTKTVTTLIHSPHYPVIPWHSI